MIHSLTNTCKWQPSTFSLNLASFFFYFYTYFVLDSSFYSSFTLALPTRGKRFHKIEGNIYTEGVAFPNSHTGIYLNRSSFSFSNSGKLKISKLVIYCNFTNKSENGWIRFISKLFMNKFYNNSIIS